MCTMRVVVLREMLGTRETGWSLFDGRQVLELTSKQIKELIKSGKKVCGLTLDSKDELILDKEGFFTTNIMEHRHCGNYKPFYSEDCMANLFCIVIGKNKDGYDCISTRFERLTLTEADVKAYLRIGFISGGCRLDANGNIEVAPLEFEKAVEPKPMIAEKKEEQPKVTEQVKEMEKKSEAIKPEVKTAEKKAEKKAETVKPETKTAEKKAETSKEKTEPKKTEKAAVKMEKATDKK